MDELKYGQLDTGSWGSRSTISGADVYIEIFNADIVLGSQEYT